MQCFSDVAINSVGCTDHIGNESDLEKQLKDGMLHAVLLLLFAVLHRVSKTLRTGYDGDCLFWSVRNHVIGTTRHLTI